MKKFFHKGAAYPWLEENEFSFRGYFIVDETLYKGASAIRYLKQNLSSGDTGESLRSLDGVFSLIWERDESTLLAVDRLRGLPLFYALVNGELWAGDDALALAQALPGVTLSLVAAEEYFATKLFVTGEDTLLNELKQVPAASYCLLKNGQASCYGYFRMTHQDFEQDLYKLEKMLREAYRLTGRRLVQALDGRTAVIPLSGGADSRMIAHLLREEGYDKVLCFTYGRKGNHESEISRQVAASYGYPWVMITYDKKNMRKLGSSADLWDYYRCAFSFSSTPHTQDLLAVKTLRDSGKLPPDGVFVPGHSGDLIAGSHVTPEFLGSSLAREKFLDMIYHKFYTKKMSPNLTTRLETRFSLCSPQDMEEMASQSEWFNIQERQAKFIVNSVRVYEHFGHEWLIPLWDNALFEAWKHVPIALRYDRQLYFQVFGNQTFSNDQVLPSTNDPTFLKSVAEEVRSIPVVRTLARRGTRFLRYFRSTYHLECMFPFLEYLVACVRESELFCGDDLICRHLLDSLRRNLARSGKPSID